MIETVKGFRDVLPPQSLKRRKVRYIIEKNFKKFGFLPVETPTIEYDEVVRGENEKDSAVSDRFRLKDRGERDLALRYEFTFQLKRMFKENPTLKLPFRRYQIGSIFRDEPVEKDRYREFMQLDADIVGDSSIKADAECLALADSICKELGISCKIKINNRKLLNAILDKIEITDKENVLRELDKIDKLGEDEVKKNLMKFADKLQILEIFKTLNQDLAFFVKNNYNGANELLELFNLLKFYKIKPEFTPFLLRGFSYYTGTIFEGYSPEIKGSLFGGGRFDNLVGKYLNRDIPAVGISFGRILDMNVEAEGIKCLLISINQDLKTLDLMNKMREKDVPCFTMDKVSKALEYADSYQIPYVIFIGEEEAKKKKFKLRNMKTGKEEMLPEAKLIKKMSEN